MSRRPPFRPLFWLLGTAMLLAAYLAFEVIARDSFAFDRAILLALRRPGNLAMPIGPGWLLQSAIDISGLGGITVLGLLCLLGIVLLLALRLRGAALWLAAVAGAALGCEILLKFIVHRPRPELVPHLAQVTTLSFPSGHAMLSAAVYLTLALMIGDRVPWLRRGCVACATALVMAIGASRVYLGVHWPSDVLAGWCFGTVLALGCYAAARRLA